MRPAEPQQDDGQRSSMGSSCTAALDDVTSHGVVELCNSLSTVRASSVRHNTNQGLQSMAVAVLRATLTDAAHAEYFNHDTGTNVIE